MLVSPVQGAEAAQQIVKAPANTQKAVVADTTQAFYFSPALVIDPKSGTDVLEYRNTSTGKVENQYPSEKDLQAYAQNSLKSADTTTAVSAAPAQAQDVKPAVASVNVVVAATATTAAQPADASKQVIV